MRYLWIFSKWRAEKGLKRVLLLILMIFDTIPIHCVFFQKWQSKHNGCGDSMADKREHSRAEIQMEIGCRNLDVFSKHNTLNISRGGVYIQTDTPLPLGTEVDLEFTLPGMEETIKVQGLVVWVHERTKISISSYQPGMGIKFEEISPEGLTMITNCVDKLLANK
jgi:type IV pilus assembly protein PilZ